MFPGRPLGRGTLPPVVSASPPLERSQFPVSERLAYLNTALMSPLPVAAVAAMTWDAEAASHLASRAFGERWATVARVRGQAATLLGASPEDVAFTRSTSEGMALVAAGLDWRPGDRVVLAAGDHDATTGPWRARAAEGVELDLVDPVGPVGELPLDGFARALDAGGGRVRVVAVSWVQAHNGWRVDLAALADLAHEHGAWLCVDAIQGLGVVPGDLVADGVDAAVAGAQKWMCGPHGIGVAYLAPALRERLRVVAPPLLLPPDAGGPDPATSARALEVGALNHIGIAGLGAALELLAEAGSDTLWAWVDGLCRRLGDGLADLGATLLSDRDGARSSLVTAAIPGVEPEEATARLAEADVVAAARGGGLRFSVHGWNDDDDIDAALAAVSDL